MTTVSVVGVAAAVILTLTFTLGIGGGIYLHKKRVAELESDQRQEVLERALDGAHSHTGEVLRVEVEKREHVQALEKMGATVTPPSHRWVVRCQPSPSVSPRTGISSYTRCSCLRP